MERRKAENANPSGNTTANRLDSIMSRVRNGNQSPESARRSITPNAEQQSNNNNSDGSNSPNQC